MRFDRDGYDRTGYYDRAVTAAQYTQELSIAITPTPAITRILQLLRSLSVSETSTVELTEVGQSPVTLVATQDGTHIDITWSPV